MSGDSEAGGAVSVRAKFDGNGDRWNDFSTDFKSLLAARGLHMIISHLQRPLEDLVESPHRSSSSSSGGGGGEEEEGGRKSGSFPIAKMSVEVFVRDNTKVCGMLGLSVTGSARALIKSFIDDFDGRGAWKALVKKYEMGTNLARQVRYQELMSMRLGPSEDPDTFIARFSTIAQQLADCGLPLAEGMKVQQLLLVMDSRKYGTIKTVIDTMDKELTVEDVRSLIQSVHQRSQLKGFDGDDSGKLASTLALSLTDRPPGNKHKGNRHQRRKDKTEGKATAGNKQSHPRPSWLAGAVAPYTSGPQALN